MKPRRPNVEILLAGLLLAAISFAAGTVLAGCGPADTGSRHSGLPSNAFHVRALTVVPFHDARPFEIAWLRETVEAHLAVLDQHNVPTRAQFTVRFYRTRQATQAAHVAQGAVPPVWSPTFITPTGVAIFTATPGWAFFDQAAVLHVWAGTPKLEGPSLAHFLLHVYGVYPGNGPHSAQFTRLDFDDYVVSLGLQGSR